MIPMRLKMIFSLIKRTWVFTRRFIIILRILTEIEKKILMKRIARYSIKVAEDLYGQGKLRRIKEISKRSDVIIYHFNKRITSNLIFQDLITSINIVQYVQTMKIAINIYKYLPTKGGGEGYLANFANQLAERGHEVHIYASKWESNNNKIHYHTIPSIRYPKFLKDISFVINSYNNMAKNDYDIVHVVGRALGMNVFNPHCGVEKAWLKQDFLSINCPGFRILKHIAGFFSLRQNFILWLDRKQYTGKGVSRIIAISDMIKNDIIKYHNIDPQKIDVVYNGVDLRRFNPDNKNKYRKL